MGAKTETVGGSPTTPLGKDFTAGLQSLWGLGGGSDQMATVMNALRGMLSGDINNPANANINTAIQQQRQDDIDTIGANMNMSGLSYSTPKAIGEADYLARSAPALQNALTERQLQAVMQLMGPLNQQTAIGTPQAQTIQKPGVLSDILGGLSGVAGMIAPFFPPAAAVSAATSGFGNQTPGGGVVGGSQAPLWG